MSYLLEHEQDVNYRNLLKDIIQYIFKDTLQSENIYQYFNQMEEGDDMSVVEMVLKEKNDLLNAGLQKGIEKITIEMIKQNLDDNFIMKITKINGKDLDELKKKVHTS